MKKKILYFIAHPNAKPSRSNFRLESLLFCRDAHIKIMSSIFVLIIIIENDFYYRNEFRLLAIKLTAQLAITTQLKTTDKNYFSFQLENKSRYKIQIQWSMK